MYSKWTKGHWKFGMFDEKRMKHDLNCIFMNDYINVAINQLLWIYIFDKINSIYKLFRVSHPSLYIISIISFYVTHRCWPTICFAER